MLKSTAIGVAKTLKKLFYNPKPQKPSIIRVHICKKIYILAIVLYLHNLTVASFRH